MRDDEAMSLARKHEEFHTEMLVILKKICNLLWYSDIMGEYLIIIGGEL
jgi:hypothetical protein